jgi:hypothetical protein
MAKGKLDTPNFVFILAGGRGLFFQGVMKAEWKRCVRAEGRGWDVYPSFSPAKITEATGKNKHLAKKDGTNVPTRRSPEMLYCGTKLCN